MIVEEVKLIIFFLIYIFRHLLLTSTIFQAASLSFTTISVLSLLLDEVCVLFLFFFGSFLSISTSFP
jgi:hypothetical protein